MSLWTGYNMKMFLTTVLEGIVKYTTVLDYSSQLYLKIPRSLAEGTVILVPKRFSKVFERKQEKSVHHFA
jgi:hypothetical protein